MQIKICERIKNFGSVGREVTVGLRIKILKPLFMSFEFLMVSVISNSSKINTSHMP